MSEQPRPPNLVFVFADQLRRSACGYTGDSSARTPRIDALAEESTDVCNAVSGHPVCAPFRASLFTGKYTTSTGMVINELRLNPNQRCLGHVLTDAGYETAYIGKWHLWANELGNHYAARNACIPPGPHRLGFDGLWAAYNFHHEYVNADYYTDGPNPMTMPGYEPDGQTDLAIDWLRQQAEGGRDAPLALFLSYGTPHDPWRQDNVPERWLAMVDDLVFTPPPNYALENDPHADAWAVLSAEERRQLPDWMHIYAAMTANLDWNVGRLLDAVEDLGLVQDTIVVFTSDHGEMFGAHGRRAKNTFYEEAIRVPFLIRWPERVQASATCDVCLNTPDIMPTLLGLLHLPSPKGVEGMDVSQRLLGQPGPEPEGAFLQGTGATPAWQDGHEWRALRDRRYTYAVYRVDGQELLFDNLTDPYQMRNLANDPAHGETRGRMRQQVEQRMATLNDTFQPCTWYRDHWTHDRIILRSATMDWTGDRKRGEKKRREEMGVADGERE
jgi:arylsulfatase A-like enzyme